MSAMPVKLGKRPAKHDPRTLRLASYLSPARLPPIPESVAWSSKVPNWPMYANDQIGDCAIAGPAHQVQAWSFNDDDTPDFTPTDEQVIGGYMRVGGYDPNNPASDNGSVLLDVMNAWRREGLFGRKIGAFVSVSPSQHDLVAAGIYLFGGLCIGLNLPRACQDHEVWKAPGRFHRWGQWAPGSWGGHCVEVVDYDSHYLTCVTWGGLKKMSWAFFDAYCDEAFAMIAPEWLGTDGKAPNGFDGVALVNDLAALR